MFRELATVCRHICCPGPLGKVTVFLCYPSYYFSGADFPFFCLPCKLGHVLKQLLSERVVVSRHCMSEFTGSSPRLVSQPRHICDRQQRLPHVLCSIIQF